jgi:hypothetical protein
VETICTDVTSRRRASLALDVVVFAAEPVAPFGDALPAVVVAGLGEAEPRSIAASQFPRPVTCTLCPTCVSRTRPPSSRNVIAPPLADPAAVLLAVVPVVPVVPVAELPDGDPLAALAVLVAADGVSIRPLVSM